MTLILFLGGCTGVQSALNPTGAEAERVHTLFWVMTIAGGIIMAAVIVAAAVAIFGRGKVRLLLSRHSFVIGAGLVFPIVTLGGLLTYGLVTFSARGSPAGEDEAFATITGQQWWWRIAYRLPDGGQVETANELRVPVGVPVALALETADVIHSFWVPNLAGKLDMIPGRTNILTITATKPGISRGQCAEYCGGAHAFMGLNLVAMPPDEFEAWLSSEAEPAAPPDSPKLQQGAELFLETGCGACHTVRGTAAYGSVGPDLTHVGGRRPHAAPTRETSPEAFAAWIEENQHIKPENKMPPFRILNEEELGDLALYLDSLE